MMMIMMMVVVNEGVAEGEGIGMLWPYQ